MDARGREVLVPEVVQRVVDRWGRDPGAVEHALFDTLYEERRRLESERPTAVSKAQAAFYDRVHGEALRGSTERQRELLRELVDAFVGEIVGHFDPRVYAVATRAIEPTLDVMLNALSPLRLADSLVGGVGRLDQQVVIEGETQSLLALARQGTVVLVPTHVSNLDSVLIGYVIWRLGLPPFHYGAGLNLFTSKVIGFFMNHLGAYKVDRRKKAALYKDVLKTYAGCTLEHGWHNVFFPGGTRSRSGAVERRLKLGLLGTGLDAFIHGLRAGRPRPDVFIVPCTLNYQLVLEAETLIDDHLKEAGRGRYIIEDDEFSRPRRVLDFLAKLFSLNSRVHVVVSHAMDVFGNRVDPSGRSLDARGREVDRSRYVLDGQGAPGFDEQRDEEYTREMAHAVTAAYARDTVIGATQLVSRVVFDLLRERDPGEDLYRLLRTGGPEPSLALVDVYPRLEAAIAHVRASAAAGAVRVDDTVGRKDPVAVLAEALAHLGSYHTRAALVRRGDRLIHQDRGLLLFYGNRVPPEGLP